MRERGRAEAAGRIRALAGLGLAGLAVALAAPLEWLPGGGAWLRTVLPAWWLPSTVVGGLLLVAAALLPGAASAGGPGDPWPTRHRGSTVALGTGLLLVCEPLLHLAILALIAYQGAPGAEEFLLPAVSNHGLATELGRLALLCLLAPLAEELFFRGRLLPFLVPRLGAASAVTISALAFAVAHATPVGCLVALPVGLLLGWLRLRHRDLGACVLVHMMHNALLLLGGPALVAAPLTMAVLWAAGALLLALATLDGRHRRLALPIGLAAAAALAAALPAGLALKDRWWAAGVARLAAPESREPAPLLSRLAAQQRRGRLTIARSAGLRQQLDGLGSPAARVLRLWFDGAAAQAASAAEAEADLRAAALVADPPAELRQAVASLGRRWPDAIAMLAIEDPDLVAGWLGPQQAVPVLAASDGPARRQLLTALERAWPGRCAGVLLSLPAGAIGPLDRRHLRQHYPDAGRLIRLLDPARQEAWTRP